MVTNKGESLRIELDSHADSSYIGSNAAIISENGHIVDVSTFVVQVGIKGKFPIVTVVVTYIDSTGYSYLLVVNEALYFPSMKHNLLNPIQIHFQLNHVNECPSH